jgi:hypothetical protein
MSIEPVLRCWLRPLADFEMTLAQKSARLGLRAVALARRGAGGRSCKGWQRLRSTIAKQLQQHVEHVD